MNTLQLLVKDPNLVDYYTTRQNYSADAGVDLIIPCDTTIVRKPLATKVDLGIYAAMYNSNGQNISYFIYSRSSTPLKHPVRVANSVGVIDANYRGELAVLLDTLEDYTIPARTPLVQIVASNGLPIKVELVKSLSATDRGTNGFGSTH